MIDSSHETAANPGVYSADELEQLSLSLSQIARATARKWYTSTKGTHSDDHPGRPASPSIEENRPHERRADAEVPHLWRSLRCLDVLRRGPVGMPALPPQGPWRGTQEGLKARDLADDQAAREGP